MKDLRHLLIDGICHWGRACTFCLSDKNYRPDFLARDAGKRGGSFVGLKIFNSIRVTTRTQ